MRRLGAAVIALLAFALPACGGGSAAGSNTRTVLVDYNYDEFATAYLAYFPQHVKVHAGDTIDFKQAWTGEPHTVTMGQILQPLGTAMAGYYDGTKAVPEEEPEDVKAASKDVPEFFGEQGGEIGQTAAQPCFLDQGPVPADGKPCPKRAQPEFNGRQALYNSGFIPYEGNNGNKFTVKLSKDIAVGNYFYECLIHGSIMGGYIEVRPPSESVPGGAQVSRDARAELDKLTKGVAKAHKAELEGKGVKREGWDIEADAEPPEEDGFPFGFTLEFYPATFKAKVGQKVKWRTDGHTVSFNVPKYGPQFTIDKDRTVALNPKAYKASNAPEPPQSSGDEHGPPGPPPLVDAGDYVAGKFISSGAQDNEIFALTFTKPGTYKYACLIHPRMIGTVVVSG